MWRDSSIRNLDLIAPAVQVGKRHPLYSGVSPLSCAGYHSLLLIVIHAIIGVTIMTRFKKSNSSKLQVHGTERAESPAAILLV